jgi:hypothetical protein
MKLLRNALFAAAVVFGASNAKADIVIDTFSAPTTATTYLIGGLNSNPATFIDTVNATTTRTVTLNVSSPSTPSLSSLGGNIGGPLGYFTMSFDNASGGSGVIAYAFSSPMNFIPNVASGGTVGSLQYLSSADSGFGPNVPLNFVIQTATGDLTFNTFMSLTATFTPTDVPLSSFTGTGDLTQVTGMTISILGGQAADVALDSIGITTPPPPNNEVPAPPAAILALMALPAVRLLRKKPVQEELATA